MKISFRNKIKIKSIFINIFILFLLAQNKTDSSSNVNSNLFKTIAIRVNLASHPPVLDPIPDITVHAGNKVIFTPTATDKDGDILTYSYSGWMNDSVYTTNINDAGNNDASEHFVTVTVSDSKLTDSQEVKITVCKAYSPLRCVNIKPEGVDGMTLSNRIFRAYPGLEYNIRAAVLGGMYPYKFSWEANKPSWLSINKNTGEISGIAPDAGFFNDIKIKITDSKGNSITAQWSIEVTTENFIFLDAVNGNPSVKNGGTATGTIDNPFRNVKDWYGTASSDISGFNNYQDYFVYYRTGIYYLDGYLDANRNMSCDGNKPSVHLAYPGEYPKFNMENGKIWVDPIYIDGLEFYNMKDYGIQTKAGKYYSTFRNLYMHGLNPVSGINNQAFINVIADTNQGKNWIWQDCKFDSSKQNGIEINNLDNSLIEDCIFTATNTHPIFPKIACSDLTIRNNIISGNKGDGIFAYLAADSTDINKKSANIEICFNNIYNCAEAGLSVNAGSYGIQGLYAYRNTIQGNIGKESIKIENVGKNPPEGQYVFENNIIVNSSLKHIVFLNCSANAMNYIKNNNNLIGYAANNIVDSTGNIKISYLQYLGTYGWQTYTPPEIKPRVPDITTNEDTPITVCLTGYENDNYDSGINLDWSISGVNSSLFTAFIDINSDLLTITPVANKYGADTVTLLLTNSKGLTDTTDIKVTVYPVNDPPVLNPISDIILNEGQAVTFNPSATDIDSNILTYTYSGWMTRSSYVTNYNDAGIHYVTVTVSDGALANSKTVKVTVLNVNRVPTAVPQSLTVNEDTPLNITLRGTDPDGDVLTCSITALPVHGTISGIAPNVTYTPNLNYNGNDSFTFKVSDGKINSYTATVSITIKPINDKPVLIPIGNKSITSGALRFIIYASDVDNNILKYTAGNLPTGANFNPLTHTFTWIPDYNQASLNYPNVLFTVTDNGIPPASCSESITITTGAINHPPVLNPIGNKTVKEGELLEFTVTGFDTDGDNLTYTAGNLPAGSDFDQLTQIFTWTPGYNQSANYTNILFTVSDNNIPPETDSKSITITVGDMNHPPVLNPIGNKAVKENALLEFFITGTDEDNNVLTYSANNLPAGAAFDSSSQKFQWYPQYNQAGNYESVLFTVTDNGVPPVSSSETITITVGNVNHPPVLNPIGNKAVAAGELLEFVITGSDVDGDILTYTAANLPPGAYFNPSTQTFTWTPGYSQSAIYTNIIFTVTDNGAPPATKNESITITVFSTK
ncbi:MAG: Ig-like domain-containing protein [bacterium]|nr:Ig-like domain-containing protein [bacterium]